MYTKSFGTEYAYARVMPSGGGDQTSKTKKTLDHRLSKSLHIFWRKSVKQYFNLLGYSRGTLAAPLVLLTIFFAVAYSITTFIASFTRQTYFPWAMKVFNKHREAHETNVQKV